MSALATLGNSLSSKIGIPATAASVPGDVSTASDVQSKVASLGTGLLGSTAATPLDTLNRKPAPAAAGSAASVVQNTTNAAANANANNPSLGAALANGQLTSATQLGTTGQNNVTQGTAATTALTTQLGQNAANINQLHGSFTTNQVQVINSTSVVATPLQVGASTYSSASNQAPKAIFDEHTFSVDPVTQQIKGTIYLLQPDGTYSAKNFDNNNQFASLMSTTDNSWVTINRGVSSADTTQVINSFAALGKTSIGLQKAQEQTNLGNQQIIDSKTQASAAQTKLTGYADQSAENQNTAALGSQLQNIFSSNANSLSNTAQAGSQAVVGSQQTAGVGANSGASLEAAGFRSANTSQQQQQAFNIAQAGQVDQQGQQVTSALDAQLGLAQKQTGLQLQTMSQDLTEAISALQSDLQYASAEQQLSIQAYINQLQQQQTALQNSAGQSGLDQSHITQIATGVASAVSQAGASYAASATKSGTANK